MGTAVGSPSAVNRGFLGETRGRGATIEPGVCVVVDLISVAMSTVRWEF